MVRLMNEGLDFLNDKQTKDLISKLLKEIGDRGMAAVLRNTIFSASKNVDWKAVRDYISKYMPEFNDCTSYKQIANRIEDKIWNL